MRITVKKIDLLLPLVCTRVDLLALRSEHLRSTFNNIKSSVVDDLDKLSSRVSLLQDNIGQDPGITDFPLRNPWEGILFLKYFFRYGQQHPPCFTDNAFSIVFAASSIISCKVSSVSTCFTLLSSIFALAYLCDPCS